MKKYGLLYLIAILFAFSSCQSTKDISEQGIAPFDWNAANMYFMLTDRFNNGDDSNDVNFGRKPNASTLRGFEGGDIRGVINKIEDGYFSKLGINAIWMTPIFEQIHGFVDEGTGETYGYHGYWTKDWTALDPNFGTMADLKELVSVAHQNGIRIVLDAVINHTGPVTEKDSVWDDEWVRTEPTCTYKNYDSTILCTLVENLPDVKTESMEDVELPKTLIAKWKSEGRYEQELAELNSYFEKTGLKRTPTNYIIKWLTDYVREFGIDGYRVDTVKHTEEGIWKDFKKACFTAFADWKANNADAVLDDNQFYIVGEVYGWSISNAFNYDYGDKQVNYYDNGFESLINFEFKYNAKDSYEAIFSKYSDRLNGDLKGLGVLNYLTSHDDGTPFDAERTKSFESATKLILSPGTSQVYYGDESARSLTVEGAIGDANLRSLMNWSEIESNPQIQKVLAHWQKLGQFRASHPAIGAGVHKMISENPYVFSRSYDKNNFSEIVVVGLDLPIGEKSLKVSFADETALLDTYSGTKCVVENGMVNLSSDFDIVLLEKIKQ